MPAAAAAAPTLPHPMSTPRYIHTVHQLITVQLHEDTAQPYGAKATNTPKDEYICNT